MVLFPKYGRKYWIVTDIWENHIPLFLECKGKAYNDGGFLFVDCEGETYKKNRMEIYRTEQKAKRVAAGENKITRGRMGLSG